MSECIQTRRLVLRPFRDADAGRVAALIGDVSVSRWLTSVPHPYTPDNARAFFARHADQDMVFAVTSENDGLIGGCTIGAELGYWLGQPHWGLGYAFEAATAVVAHHFGRSQAALRSGYMLGNQASARVLSKLGFVPTQIDLAQCQATQTAVTVQKVELTHAAWQGAT
ncbi:GNAT family N-acetyltransferase [Roseobacter sp.]|uniref:GNAT family N-acetyltransferase n=1 Tax=Roseobacter sp. TaxID=1907202 RepID=UPI003299B3E4